MGLIVIGLAPGLWWRTAIPLESGPPDVAFTKIGAHPSPGWPKGISLQGVWEITGDPRIYGYSALIPLDADHLAAVSDNGTAISFGAPGAPPEPAKWFQVGPNRLSRGGRDSESASRDPETGTLWIGIERKNAIARIDPRDRGEDQVRPAAMAEWPGNGGPEALVHLADGRFIVLGESKGTYTYEPGPGLLFSRDPLTEGVSARQFDLELPEGFLATDMAQVPDGRVLILLRRLDFGWPPEFRTRLIIADPDEIREGRPWPWKPFADFDPPFPAENYEGLAVSLLADGAVRIWMISDDNRSAYQRTLLAELRWQPGEPNISNVEE